LLFSYGAYVWGVRCTDTSGNSTGSANSSFTVAGDVAASDLTFSPPSPAEGSAVTITAYTANNGNATETPSVEFWDGETLLDTTLVTMSPFGSNTTSTLWNATIGLHNFYIVVDPPNGSGSIVEYDESNNIARRSLLISTWQLYYGNVTGNIRLDTNANFTFNNWYVLNRSGNIYVSGTDTTNGISFSSLRSFGRNTTGGQDGNTADDFLELDAVLNTSSSSDNVNITFTNSPRVENFTLFGSNVTSVPIINSTATGSFTTGLLWDSADTNETYYENRTLADVVFVTKVRMQLNSTYGNVDYEIRVPAQIKEYKGSTDTVTFYYEVQ
jgi:hypothetical protein